MCKACQTKSRLSGMGQLKNKKDTRKAEVIVVKAGETFTAREGQFFRALKGSYVIAKRGSSGDFLPGSTGVAERGSMYTAWKDAVVHGKYGSVGRAHKGAKLILNYGAELPVNHGAKVTMMADDEEHLVQGSRLAPVSTLNPEERTLVDKAWAASQRAYCPYSNFPVGAAVLATNESTGERRIFSGCNVECASYGGTVCAERVACFDAVNNGFRRIEMVAVVCAKSPGGSPCGFCRQVLREFGLNKKTGLNATVLNIFNKHTVVRWTVDGLLPDSFGPDSL